MASKQRRGTWVLSSLVGGAVLRIGSAQAIDIAHRFDIPAESLSQALADFSRTSARRVVYSQAMVKGRKTPGLHGSYTAGEALEALLAGTDLRVDANSSGVLTIGARTIIDTTRNLVPTKEATPFQRVAYQPADQPG